MQTNIPESAVSSLTHLKTDTPKASFTRVKKVIIAIACVVFFLLVCLMGHFLFSLG